VLPKDTLAVLLPRGFTQRQCGRLAAAVPPNANSKGDDYAN